MSLPQDNIFYQRDTLELEFQLFKNKATNEYWDLTDYKIRFQLIDGTVVIKKATANVSGGSSDEINITNPTLGKFIVVITTLESTNLSPDDYTYQIQIESPTGKKYTVLQDSIRILPALINWEIKESGE
jgi:hypothetical protein